VLVGEVSRGDIYCLVGVIGGEAVVWSIVAVDVESVVQLLDHDNKENASNRPLFQSQEALRPRSRNVTARRLRPTASC
jgi:hypothetical protein